ncbi:hypothetical protein [Botrimarina mediterranea]|uniref:hypothetical protein n=1 Tax=Botrimarina mediterranea TaxID=2528022 RepID=UPI0018D409F6|nr:hypothetical protein [Botrimarina mediterranea]
MRHATAALLQELVRRPPQRINGAPGNKASRRRESSVGSGYPTRTDDSRRRLAVTL